jgi:hypothetical protein
MLGAEYRPLPLPYQTQARVSSATLCRCHFAHPSVWRQAFPRGQLVVWPQAWEQQGAVAWIWPFWPLGLLESPASSNVVPTALACMGGLEAVESFCRTIIVVVTRRAGFYRTVSRDNYLGQPDMNTHFRPCSPTTTDFQSAFKFQSGE